MYTNKQEVNGLKFDEISEDFILELAEMEASLSLTEVVSLRSVNRSPTGMGWRRNRR